MKFMRAVWLCTTAGLAASAVGQSVTLHFDVDGDPLTSVDPSVVYNGTPVTWTVFASYTGYAAASTYFGGFVGSFSVDPGSGGSSIGSVGNFVNLMGGAGTTPTANGTTIENINIFNNALLGTDDPSNPIAIFTFDLTIDDVSGGDPDLPFSVRYTADGVAQMFPDGNIFTLFDEFEEFGVISDTLFVPGGGAGAVLGFGALVSHGQRRRIGGVES
jgi:hypothetical protein